MINLLRSKETSIFKKGDGVAAQLRITNRGISTKVEQNGVVSAINQSPESITIDAAKVNIEGAALFTSGRLSESSLNSAYDASGTASSALASAKSYADTKVGAAAYRTQRIYYRATSATSLTGPTTWLSTSGTGYGNWSTKVPPLTNNDTKHPFLYTCVQSQTVAQSTGTTCTCTSVLLDDTATVIDGGSIITGSVAANAINATSGTFDTANIPNLSAAKITSGDISADRIKANVITAINSLTAGTIDAARINASALSIGYSQISDTPAIPSKTSDLTNDSSFATTTEASSYASTAESNAKGYTDSELTGYSTTTAMNTAISTAVDSIDIGGRNLLRNTASPSTNDVVLSRATLNRDGTVRLTPATLAGTTLAGSCKWRVDYLDYADYQNETYTISCDARLADVASSYTDVLFCMYAVVNTATRLDNVVSSSYDAYKEYTFDTVTTDWQRFSVTISVPTDLTSGTSAALVSGSQLTVQFTAGKSTKPLDIRNVKLERGNKPTDWTAAPEDTVNYLTTVNNTGIMVHPSNDSTSGVKVTDVVDIMRSGVSVAEYGDTARIGKTGQSYVSVQSDGMSVYNNSGSAEIVTLKHKTLTNAGFGELAFLSNGNAYSGGVIKATNGNKFDNISFNVGSSDVSTTITSSDPDNGTSASIVVDGTNSKIRMNSPLCFLADTANGGSNIIGIYAGSTIATLSNGNWASLASKSTLESKLGSGVTNQNTIIIAQNGDCDAVGNYAFSGAITSDGAARGYVYPAISGSVRWNWIAIRFSN